MCNGDKLVYSKKDAQTKLNLLRVGKKKSNNRRRKTKHRPARIYYCSLCKGWHLTSKEKGDFHEDY